MRKPRGSDGEDENTYLAGRRVKTKAYEFVERETVICLCEHARYPPTVSTKLKYFDTT